MQDKPNILFLTHVSTYGGTGKYLLTVFRALSPNYQCHLICQEPGPLPENAKAAGVNTSFRRLRAWRKPKYFFLNWLTVNAIVHYCRIHGIKAIVSNFYRVTPFAVCAAKKLGIPSLTVIHDHAPVEKLAVFKVFDCDQLICVSQSTREHVDKHFDREKTVIYNVIDAEVFARQASTQAFRKEFALCDTTKVIVAIGSIVPDKGYDIFLQAMKIVSQEFDDIACFIVGRSPDEDLLNITDLKEYARRLGIENKVFFTGRREDISSILAASDLLAHASFKEAFGRVIIEAMAMKKAVVTTDCGGPREIVVHNQTGILVPVKDVQRLAEGCIELLRNEDKRRQMGQKGFDRVNELFSEEHIKEKILKVFLQLV